MAARHSGNEQTQGPLGNPQAQGAAPAGLRPGLRPSQIPAESGPSGQIQPEQLPPEAEMVLRVFHGTIIQLKQGAQDEHKPL